MSFIGEAIAGLGATVSSAGGPVAAAAGGGLSALGSGVGWLGSTLGSLGSGFWAALSAGATILGTAHTIQSNNRMAREVVFDTVMQGEASALDTQRRRADARAESERETARRTTLLAAQGGLTDGADLVLESLLEGARADERMVTDMGFEQGAISRRIGNTLRGARRSNIGALIQGGARITDLLARK